MIQNTYSEFHRTEMLEATTLLIKQLADPCLVIVTGDEVKVPQNVIVRQCEHLRAWLNDDLHNTIALACLKWFRKQTNSCIPYHL